MTSTQLTRRRKVGRAWRTAWAAGEGADGRAERHEGPAATWRSTERPTLNARAD